MPSIISFGEALIDLYFESTPDKCIDPSSQIFQVGGSPANVAIAAARLNVSTAFVGKLGADHFGFTIKQLLDAEKINTHHITFTDQAKTAIAFVMFNPLDGSVVFHVWRDPGADQLINELDVPESVFQGARLFHFGSLSLTNENAIQATNKAIEFAKKYGLIISMDPNLRPDCFSEKSSVVEKVLNFIPSCTILKVNEQEAKLLSNSKTIETSASELQQQGPQIVVVTTEAKGCYFQTSKTKGWIAGFETDSKDAFGAGDAFMGGFLASLLQNGYSIETSLTDEALHHSLVYANAVAALAVSKVGTTASYPYEHDVNVYLEKTIKLDNVLKERVKQWQ